MNKFWKTVLTTTVLAGTADIIAATLMAWMRSGKFPAKILHYIAGGGLGLERSMKGGASTALLGLCFHYFIAFSFTLLFFIAFPRLVFLQGNKYLTGFFYGQFVGMFMAFVVLPLSALPPSPFKLGNALISWTVLSVAIGIPVAMMANKFYKSSTV